MDSTGGGKIRIKTGISENDDVALQNRILA